MPTMKLGDTAQVSKTITETDIRLYAGVTGDFNPLHVDHEYAAATRFKGPIAHGALTAGLISTLIGMKLPGTGCAYLGQNLRFLAPVRPGDTITAKGEVIHVREDKPIVTLKTECFNQRGELVVSGEATIYVPEHL